MANKQFVTIATVKERFNLTNYTPELNLEEAKVTVADVNRPALQLHGFYEHFEPSRIQVIGNVETAYLAKKSDEDKAAASDYIADAFSGVETVEKREKKTSQIVDIARLRMYVLLLGVVVILETAGIALLIAL